MGEAKLEQYLDEHPQFEHATINTKEDLKEAKKLLVQSAGGDGSKSSASMDAQLLLAKLSFVCGKFQFTYYLILSKYVILLFSGDYPKALQYLTDVGLKHLTEKQLPSRSLRVVAESFAVHGLALERTPDSQTGTMKGPEKELTIIKSLETAGDIALLYFQEQDKLQGCIF